MLISKKNRREVYKYLFKGAAVAIFELCFVLIRGTLMEGFLRKYLKLYRNEMVVVNNPGKKG
jgi:nitrogenase molybdenum-iron protein alpha/beta subunit